MRLRFKNKKLLTLMAAAAIIFPACVVNATTQNIGATATFLAAITLTAQTNISFGTITYGAAPGASDWVKVDTQDTRTLNGTFAVGGAAAVSSGDVRITGGTVGQTLNISCSSLASGAPKMANAAGTTTIGLDQIIVAAESAPGTAQTCTGVGNTVLSMTLTTTTNDDIFVGARVIGPSTGAAWAGGAYSTGNTNGVPITVQVVYP